MGYVSVAGDYYEGDRARPGDLEVSTRPSAHHVWSGGAWIADLTALSADRSEAMNAACRAAIYAGFTSTALGEAHQYPANDKDQSNLAASVLDSILPGLPVDWTTPFWCADAQAVWAFRPHTAAQIQQVGRDAKAAIVAALMQNATRQAAIAAATDADEIAGVAWE